MSTLRSGRLELDLDDGSIRLAVADGPDVDWRRLGHVGDDPEVPEDAEADLEHLRREWAEHTAWDPRSEVGHFYAIAKGVR